jgi:hypothetical protein
MVVVMNRSHVVDGTVPHPPVESTIRWAYEFVARPVRDEREARHRAIVAELLVRVEVARWN